MIIQEGQRIGFNDIFDSKGSLTDANKLMTALNSLMTSKFKGGMDNLASTLKGRLSTTIGTLQYNVAQMFGIMEDGSVRSGSAIEKVNQALEKLNTYLESAEGKKKVEEFSKALDDLVKNFNVDSLVENFNKLGTKLDDVIEKATRFAGLFAGFRAGATIGGVAGPQGSAAGGLIGAALGWFSPELVKLFERTEPVEMVNGKPVESNILNKTNELNKSNILNKTNELNKNNILTKTNELNKSNETNKYNELNKSNETNKYNELNRNNITEKHINFLKEQKFTNTYAETAIPYGATRDNPKVININITGNNTFNNGQDANNLAQKITDKLKNSN